MKCRFILASFLAFAVLAVSSRFAQAQGYGTDTQNVLGPASGGMAGVSIAMPQDVPSAIFGNPATLAQFKGTQFCFGGGWVEGYPTISNDGSINGGTPFSVTSRTQGFALPEVGVTQDLRSVGVNGAFGLGLSGLSGLGAEYLNSAPGTILNNLNSQYMVLGITPAVGVQLNDKLSVGASATLGIGFEQLGFVGPIVGSAMVHDYAIRGTVGADYAVNEVNTIGAFYQSRMDFQFPDAIRVGGVYHDLTIDQPDTFGLGVADKSLMNGNLLLAADVYYKLWEDAALWQDVLVNQWAFAVGAQLTQGCYKYRLGYSYNGNPINHSVGDSLDGNPIGQQFVQLFQAANVPLVYQNRITGGIGREGFLVPCLDLDLFAGGLLKGEDSFGPDTTAKLAVYYVGLGLTWKFDYCCPHVDCGTPACGDSAGN